MNTGQPNILVLGTTGMVGSTIYEYLASQYPEHVWGTTRTKREDGHTFFLDVATTEENFSAILHQLKQIDFIINCIGALRNSVSDSEMKSINADFPNTLVKYALHHKTRIIHISSDAVFQPLSGDVTEDAVPHPQDWYGKTKLQGEVSSDYFLSLRTSLIGIDSLEHKGIIDWVLNEKGTLYGYENQTWAGCTSYQFAKLCEKIIVQHAFDALRKNSPVYHFAPLQVPSKYRLLQDIVHVAQLRKTIRKSCGETITRRLVTKFPLALWLHTFAADAEEALYELFHYKKQ